MADQPHTSAILSLLPRDPDRYTVDGGDDAGEMHVTCKYLADDVDADGLDDNATLAVKDAVEKVVARTPTGFAPTITDVGPLGDEGAVVLFLDDDAMRQFRDDLAGEVGQVWDRPDDYPDWKPHLTLGYADPPDDTAGLVEAGQSFIGQQVELDRVGFHRAGQRAELPIDALPAVDDVQEDDMDFAVASKAPPLLVGIPVTAPTDLPTAGDGLPYQAADLYVAMFEIKLKADQSPGQVAAAVAGLEIPETTIPVKTSITASAGGSQRRGLLLDNSDAGIVAVYDQIIAALEAGGLKPGDYPFAVQLGTVDLAAVKALKGSDITIAGQPIVIDQAGQLVTADQAEPAPAEPTAPPVPAPSVQAAVNAGVGGATIEFGSNMQLGNPWHDDQGLFAPKGQGDRGGGGGGANDGAGGGGGGPAGLAGGTGGVPQARAPRGGGRGGGVSAPGGGGGNAGGGGGGGGGGGRDPVDRGAGEPANYDQGVWTDAQGRVVGYSDAEDGPIVDEAGGELYPSYDERRTDEDTPADGDTPTSGMTPEEAAADAARLADPANWTPEETEFFSWAGGLSDDERNGFQAAFGLGPNPDGTPGIRAAAPRIEEDDTPVSSPTGATLTDYQGTGNGIGIYSDGYTFDGNGWRNPAGQQTNDQAGQRGSDLTTGGQQMSDTSTIDTPTKPASKPKWEGLLVIEGVPSGDGRFIEQGALTWRDLPLPLMLMTRNPEGGMGHDGAELAGRIDGIERRGDEIWGFGVLDPGSNAGAEAARLLTPDDEGVAFLRGVSVDLDDVTVAQAELAEDGDPLEALLRGPEGMRVGKARLMGATLCPFPAFQEAAVSLVSDVLIASVYGAEDCDCHDEHVDAFVASAGPAQPGTQLRIYTPWTEGNGRALVASGSVIPIEPPISWFQCPTLADQQFGIRIDPSGRVYGLAASWDSCHISFPKMCQKPPRSMSGYRFFQNKQTLTSEGVMVATGPIIMDSVHPSLLMQASDAQAFYAHTGSAVADVAVYETDRGIAVAGALRPTATEAQIRALRGSDMSPDWRPINGRHEMVALLAVNTSGFITPALVASAGDIETWVAPGVPAFGIGTIDGTEQVIGLVAAGAMPQEASGWQARIEQLEAQMSATMDIVGPMLEEKRHERAALALQRLGIIPRAERSRRAVARFTAHTEE